MVGDQVRCNLITGQGLNNYLLDHKIYELEVVLCCFCVHLARISLEEVVQVVYYVELMFFAENGGLLQESTAVYSVFGDFLLNRSVL